MFYWGLQTYDSMIFFFQLLSQSLFLSKLQLNREEKQ